jgi:hypothetical protein
LDILDLTPSIDAKCSHTFIRLSAGKRNDTVFRITRLPRRFAFLATHALRWHDLLRPPHVLGMPSLSLPAAGTSTFNVTMLPV